MKLLELPPELLSDIIDLVNTPSSPSTLLPLALVHSSLSPLVISLLHRDVLLTSSAHIRTFLNSPTFPLYSSCTRRLRFIPRNGDGGARGEVGSGVGTAETVEGAAVTELLGELRRRWEDDADQDERRGRGIEELDIASVASLRPEVLEGDWLAALRSLTIGTAFLPPTQQTQRPLFFSFRLQSLTLHNDHWRALDPSLLTQLLHSAEPNLARDETISTLKHLDLSSTYDVGGFAPFLSSLSPPSDELDPITYFSGLTSLRFPPFETSDHLGFALSALSSCSPSHLSYLELPPLSNATGGAHDVLWARLSELFGEGGVAEVGLKGYATRALVETTKAVLVASGADTGAEKGKGEGQRGLRRLRFRKLIRVEELERVAGGAETLELAREYGLEMLCGARVED